MEYSIIDRTQILSRLDMKEIPLPRTIEYVYYYITYNSCWYNDYLTRYFPNYYFSILLFETEINEIMKEQCQKMGVNFDDRINLEKHFVPQFDPTNERHFIKVGFVNSFFTLKVSEIICGKNITDEQLEKLTLNLPKKDSIKPKPINFNL
jgi:hypothetical protein